MIPYGDLAAERLELLFWLISQEIGFAQDNIRGLGDALAEPDMNGLVREAYGNSLSSTKNDVLRFVTVNETIKSVEQRGFKVTLTEKRDLDYAFNKLIDWPGTREMAARRAAFRDLEKKHNEAQRVSKEPL